MAGLRLRQWGYSRWANEARALALPVRQDFLEEAGFWGQRAFAVPKECAERRAFGEQTGFAMPLAPAAEGQPAESPACALLEPSA